MNKRCHSAHNQLVAGVFLVKDRGYQEVNKSLLQIELLEYAMTVELFTIILACIDVCRRGGLVAGALGC